MERKKGKKNRKHGRKLRQPAFARWKERYNKGLGLKHRRMARRAL
ncbi:MAG TPA: hypothetical protein VJK71_01795 [Gemmatimonadales bacterium]|nr:hypothetical protein [Gemmatimonadales bacterium]